MNLPQPTTTSATRPAEIDSRRQQAHQCLDALLDFCADSRLPFLAFEKQLLARLLELGKIFVALFLFARHANIDLRPWHQRGYRLADADARRTLSTAFGDVTYRRVYFISKEKGKPGVHPLDAELGLTRDSFSPLLIGWCCRLATLLSFRLSSETVASFLGWAPPASTIQAWVQGLGQPAHAFMTAGPLPEGDGEVLVIELDGKAVPTATEAELQKRRRPHCKESGCSHDGGCRKCPRHRRRERRKPRGRKKKRKKGDKSKNGRSAVLVAMYTLQRSPDGKLHGPLNKKVYGTFGSRKKAMEWARQQATRRGFGPDTDKVVQIVLGGEICLEQRARKLFPKAIITLDIRHAQERLWQAGRLFHREGTAELAEWVGELEGWLYAGRVTRLLRRLREVLAGVGKQGPGTKEKRQKLEEVIAYLKKRKRLMKYGSWRVQDLVIASGVVEGAARYVVGERLDNSGMRWIEERSEAVLLLRCIEVNGDWDAFWAWADERRRSDLAAGKAVWIRSASPTQLPENE